MKEFSIVHIYYGFDRDCRNKEVDFLIELCKNEGKELNKMRLYNPPVDRKNELCYACKFRPFSSQKFGYGCHKGPVHEIDERGYCTDFIRPKVSRRVAIIK